MRQFFSTILSRIYSRKKIILGGLAIAVLLSFVPLNVAEANIFSDILNGIKNLPVSIPVLVIAIPLFVLAGVMGAITTVLSTLMLVFVKATMAIGVTPANQEIVEIGWNISLGLVNIVFILVLVFIGLATILRLQTYQLQKTLPSLIIIALLVNFSGVLVGFVVDIGNIFTTAFLSKATSFAALGQGLLGVGEQILEMVTAPGLTIFTEAISLILQIIAQFIYFFFAALIMFVIMLLFFMRAVILWILAILAPIAFACYILPATKRFWTQWLQTLIQWSIVGIPISLFLFISSQILPKMNSVLEKKGPDGTSIAEGLKNAFTAYPSLSDVIVSIVGNFMVLALLFVGVTLSMQMAPAGAQGVMNWGKTRGLAVGKWAAREGWRNIARGKAVEKFGANIRKRGQGLEVKAEDQTRLEKLMGGMGFIGKNRIARFGARVLGSGVEIGSKEINTRVKKRDEESIAQGEKDVGKSKGQGIKNLRQEKLKPTLRDDSRMVGWITGEIKNGNKKGVNKAIEDGELSTDDIIRMHRNATENGNDEARELLERAFPTIKDRGEPDGVKKNPFGLDDKKWGDMVKDYSQKDIADKVLTTEDTLTKNDAGDITGVNAEFINELLEKGNRRLIPQILEKGDPQEQQALWAHIKSLGAQKLHDMGRDDILTWSFGPAATNLGMDTIPIDPNDPTKGVVTRDYITQMQREQLSKEGLEEQKAKVAQQLGGLQTGGLDPLQQRLADLQGQLAAAPNSRARQPIRNQINRTNREIQERIRGLGEQQRTIEEDLRLWQMSIEALEKETETLEGEVSKINAQPVDTRDYARRDELLDKQLPRVRQIRQERTRQGGLAQRELNVLNDAVNSRYPASPGAPPKTRAEVEQEVKTEYERKYRASLLNQLGREGAFIQWLADSSAGTATPMNHAEAEQERIRQLYERLRLHDILPKLTPSPLSKETALFDKIATGSTGLPKMGDRQRERKLTGAINRGLQTMEKIEGEINRLSREVSEIEGKGGDASAQRGTRDRWHTQLNGLKTRVEDIRVELAKTP